MTLDLLNPFEGKRLLISNFAKFSLFRALLVGFHHYCASAREYKRNNFRFLGEGAVIHKTVSFIAPQRVVIGKCAYIASGCCISALGGFHLGNYSGLGAGTKVLTTEHQHCGAECIPFGKMRFIKPVYIEDYVWVGANVNILPGVRIGEGAIIGLGSVVRRDVPAMAVVMGNPAQVVGYRNKDEFERLKSKGAVRAPSQKSTHLWIPPLTRKKYGELLKEFGFDEHDFVSSITNSDPLTRTDAVD